MSAWHEDDAVWSRFLDDTSPADVERVENEAAGFLDITRLPEGGRVLDVGCGRGEVALALARRGVAVTALDRSAQRLRRVSQVAESEGLNVEIVRRDLRGFTRPRHFHAIRWTGDAVGLFTPELELEVLRALRDALRPEGRLVIGARGKEVIARDLQPQRWRWLDSETLVLEEHDIDDGFANHRVRFTRVKAGKLEHAEATWQLYSGAELKGRLRAAGFDRVRLFGDMHRARYDGAAVRLVAVAAR